MSTEQSDARFREDIIDQVDAILRSCEEAKRPLEVDPARSELFDLFAAVEATGGLIDDHPLDLGADGLCKTLADRWGLKSATQSSIQTNQALPPDQLARMRSLWSLLRMWMEWTYAWERWSDFHTPQGERKPRKVVTDAPTGTDSE